MGELITEKFVGYLDLVKIVQYENNEDYEINQVFNKSVKELEKLRLIELYDDNKTYKYLSGGFEERVYRLKDDDFLAKRSNILAGLKKYVALGTDTALLRYAILSMTNSPEYDVRRNFLRIIERKATPTGIKIESLEHLCKYYESKNNKDAVWELLNRYKINLLNNTEFIYIYLKFSWAIENEKKIMECIQLMREFVNKNEENLCQNYQNYNILLELLKRWSGSIKIKFENNKNKVENRRITATKYHQLIQDIKKDCESLAVYFTIFNKSYELILEQELGDMSSDEYIKSLYNMRITLNEIKKLFCTEYLNTIPQYHRFVVSIDEMIETIDTISAIAIS